MREFYDRHARAIDLAFFAGGFAFDVLTAGAGVDDPVMVATQVLYLAAIGGLLFVAFVREADPAAMPMPPWLERAWHYRSPAIHFCFGSLMNLYSIFFLMSASLFSSIVFVAVLFGVVILNEVPFVRRRGLDVKVAFYVLCLFCFWSLLVPLLLGSVGRATFALSFAGTAAVLALLLDRLRRRVGWRRVGRRLVAPGLSVIGGFVLFYLIGWIPPVPIAAKTLGVFHHVERVGDEYRLTYQPSPWRPWRGDDREFVAEPGDALYVFFAIYSPARFADTVFVHLSRYDGGAGWVTTDRLPIAITGGRRTGFRGFAVKQNYTDGEWRVKVETTDEREIARLHFTVRRAGPDPGRVLVTRAYK